MVSDMLNEEMPWREPTKSDIVLQEHTLRNREGWVKFISSRFCKFPEFTAVIKSEDYLPLLILSAVVATEATDF